MLQSLAIVAALVPIPSTNLAGLSPAFWAVIIALPFGKLVGITGGAAIATALARRSTGSTAHLPLPDIIAVAGLGGIGFTVSLLMNELAFEGQGSVADEVTLAVIVASVIAALVGGVLTSLRSRHYARAATADR